MRCSGESFLLLEKQRDFDSGCIVQICLRQCHNAGELYLKLRCGRALDRKLLGLAQSPSGEEKKHVWCPNRLSEPRVPEKNRWMEVVLSSLLLWLATTCVAGLASTLDNNSHTIVILP